MDVLNYHKATSLDDALNVLNQDPTNAILGGGAWIKQLNKKVNTLIDLCDLNLNQIRVLDTCIEVGAMTTLRDMEINPDIAKLGNGFLVDAIQQILGIPFRNIATIGGTIFGRYSFSDVITPLLTLDVTLIFHQSKAIKLNDYLNQKGKLNDVLIALQIEKNSGKAFFKKVSNTQLDFSILNIAIHKNIDQKFFIALGARPGVAMLAEKSMAMLNEKTNISDEMIEQVADQVILEIPISSNQLASDIYRKELAKTYVIRGIKEVMNNEN
jgi:CO/xanthine dehydrogenase FAD-binding subunit